MIRGLFLSPGGPFCQHRIWAASSPLGIDDGPAHLPTWCGLCNSSYMGPVRPRTLAGSCSPADPRRTSSQSVQNEDALGSTGQDEPGHSFFIAVSSLSPGRLSPSKPHQGSYFTLAKQHQFLPSGILVWSLGFLTGNQKFLQEPLTLLEILLRPKRLS